VKETICSSGPPANKQMSLCPVTLKPRRVPSWFN
jgi:hypothetical protein